MPNIYLICGPPGSGKTRYVKEHMREGDLILDLDWIGMALSGREYYNRPANLFPYYKVTFYAVLQKLMSDRETYNAWIIRGMADSVRRQEFKKLYNAKVIVLAISPSDCIKNIMQDDRRQENVNLWEGIIRQWWHDYSPNGDETTIKELR